MAKLTWDDFKNFESGIDRGVFYPKDGPGEAWNGLVSVNETPDADNKTRYIDGVNTHQRRRLADFSGTIDAFSHPDSFYESVLTQNRSKNFGLSYRVMTEDSYKIHLVYNVLVLPTSFGYRPFESDPFSWVFETKPLVIPGAKASAHIVIDTFLAYDWTVLALEDILYGNDSETPRLPSPLEVFGIFEENSILQVTDNGDGTFTVTGPDEAIQMLDSSTFQISWPSAIYIDAVSYNISSL